MEIVFWVHLLIIFIVCSIPVWHIKYLKYGVYIPYMISIMWLVFNGCPITKLQKTNSSSFTHDLLRYFKLDAT